MTKKSVNEWLEYGVAFGLGLRTTKPLLCYHDKIISRHIYYFTRLSQVYYTMPKVEEKCFLVDVIM